MPIQMQRVQYIDDQGPATLDFQFPATSRPLYNKDAKRTDTFSTAGVRQSVVLRTDNSFPITMGTILKGDYSGQSDEWQRFLDYAVPGGTFTYVPDVDDETNSFQCFLVETSGKLEYVAPNWYKFSGTFQVEVQA